MHSPENSDSSLHSPENSDSSFQIAKNISYSYKNPSVEDFKKEWTELVNKKLSANISQKGIAKLQAVEKAGIFLQIASNVIAMPAAVAVIPVSLYNLYADNKEVISDLDRLSESFRDHTWQHLTYDLRSSKEEIPELRQQAKSAATRVQQKLNTYYKTSKDASVKNILKDYISLSPDNFDKYLYQILARRGEKGALSRDPIQLYSAIYAVSANHRNNIMNDVLEYADAEANRLENGMFLMDAQVVMAEGFRNSLKISESDYITAINSIPLGPLRREFDKEWKELRHGKTLKNFQQRAGQEQKIRDQYVAEKLLSDEWSA